MAKQGVHSKADCRPKELARHGQHGNSRRLGWDLMCAQPNPFQVKRNYRTVVRVSERSFVSRKNRTTTTADTRAMPIR